MKVFLSAYACMPNRGSEQGVGWNWVLGLSSKVELTVLTRQSKRRSIEDYLASLPESHPMHDVEFVYYDLSAAYLKLKQSGMLPTFIYYLLWQRTAATKFHGLAEQHDVVHHLTFCSILCPGFWRLSKAKFVAGPIGGPVVPDQYLPMFGLVGCWLQKIRGILIRNFDKIPWVIESYRRASVVVPANTDTKCLLEEKGVGCTEVLLDTACPDVPADRMTREDGVVRFISAGRLDRRKGIEIQIKAFAKAVTKLGDQAGMRLEIIGEGADVDRLESLATSLGISNYIEFSGAVSRNKVLEAFLRADVFMFTSIRDTSASVNLEAMACGLPVICLSHQGVAEITCDETALRVKPSGIEGTIEGVAEAIVRMMEDGSERREMGQRARCRAVNKFTWASKFEKMMSYYQFADVD